MSLDDERVKYNEWLTDNEENIIIAYTESIECVDDVPEGFLQAYYENAMEERIKAGYKV